MKTKYFGIFLSLSLSALLYASNRVGNGGDYLSCNEDNKQHEGLYDFFEAKTTHKLNLLNYDTSLSYEEILQDIFKRLELRNPSRAKKYKEWYADFWKETKLEYEFKLVDIPDTGMGRIPHGCELLQFAGQNIEPDATLSRYEIDGNIWNSASPVDQAGLVMHELILREKSTGLLASHTTENVRYLTGLLFAEEWSIWDLKTLVGKIESLNFRSFDVAGLNAVLPKAFGSPFAEIDYWSDSLVKGAVILDTLNIHKEFSLKLFGYVDFQLDQSLSQYQAYLDPTQLDLIDSNANGTVFVKSAAFDTENNLAQLKLGYSNQAQEPLKLKGKNFEILVHNDEINLRNIELSFYANNKVKDISFAHEVKLYSENGALIKEKKNTPVLLDKNGNIVQL